MSPEQRIGRFTTASRGTRSPDAWIGAAAAILIVPLLVSAVGLWLYAGLPHTYLDKDTAMMELYTLHAAHGTQLVGPYSRFGWNHPGPALFYAYAPLYELSGRNASSLFVMARLINAACLVMLLFAVNRLAGPDKSLVLAGVILAAMYVLHIGLDRLTSPWNPDIIILPFALYIVLAAGFAMGRWWTFPLLVFIGSIVVQSHAGALLAALSVAGAAGLLLCLKTVRPRTWIPSGGAGRAGQRPAGTVHHEAQSLGITCGGRLRPAAGLADAGGSPAFWLLLGVAILLVMWFPPILEELSNRPGNLTRLYGFFAAGGPSIDPLERALAVCKQLSWPPLMVVRAVLPEIPRFEYDLLAGLLTLGLLAAMPLCFWEGRRSFNEFSACMAALGMAGMVASIWSVLRIQGDVFTYLLYWASAVGFLSWLVVSAMSARRALRFVETRGYPNALSYSRALAVAVAALLVLPQAPAAWRGSLVPPLNSEKVQVLALGLLDHLRVNQTGAITVRFNWADWSVQTGVITWLYKSDVDFCIQDEWPVHGRGWPLLFPEKSNAGYSRDRYIVFRDHKPYPEDNCVCAVRDSGTAIYVCGRNRKTAP